MPDAMRRNFWIVSLHNDEPITAEGVAEHAKHLQEQKVEMMHVTLDSRSESTMSDYEEIRVIFDQVRPCIHKLVSRKAL